MLVFNTQSIITITLASRSRAVYDRGYFTRYRTVGRNRLNPNAVCSFMSFVHYLYIQFQRGDTGLGCLQRKIFYQRGIM